jgi:hypothetical protein
VTVPAAPGAPARRADGASPAGTSPAGPLARLDAASALEPSLVTIEVAFDENDVRLDHERDAILHEDVGTRWNVERADVRERPFEHVPVRRHEIGARVVAARKGGRMRRQ